MILSDTSSWAVVYDMFLVLGFSVVMWLCFHMLTLVLPLRRAVPAVILYVLFFAAAGLIAFCFVVGATASRQLRWHMTAGFVLGARIYYSWFSRYTQKLFGLFKTLLYGMWHPVAWVWQLLRRALLDRAAACLQRKWAILYNRAKQKGLERKKYRRKKVVKRQDEKKRKKPTQAYTQS